MKPDADQTLAFWLNVVMIDGAALVLLTTVAGRVLEPTWVYLAMFVALFPCSYYVMDLVNYVRWLRQVDRDD